MGYGYKYNTNNPRKKNVVKEIETPSKRSEDSGGSLTQGIRQSDQTKKESTGGE
jgi:hypothetical protein